MEVSLVIPAYNEEKRIKRTLMQAHQYMKATFDSYEIIVVDDGSQDGTRALVEGLPVAGIKLIALEHRGKGHALRQGMLSASGDVVFFTDADLPYALTNISESLEIMNNKAEKVHAVIGARDLYREKSQRPYPLHRRILSRGYAMIVDAVLKLDIPDTQCGFKGFRGDIVEELFSQLTIDGFGYDIELLYLMRKLGYVIYRLPVQVNHQEGSKVHLIRDSIRMFKDIIIVRRRESKGEYHGSRGNHGKIREQV